jgi:hypothetical protein
MGSLLTILVGLAVVSVVPLSGVPSRVRQPEHVRAAFSPIACSWARIDRRRNIMEKTLFGAAGVERNTPHKVESLFLALQGSAAGRHVICRR